MNNLRIDFYNRIYGNINIDINFNRVPYRYRAQHMYNRTSKDPRPYSEVIASRYLHGYDVYNI